MTKDVFAINSNKRSRMLLKPKTLLFILCFFVCYSNLASAMYQKELWPLWEMNNPLSTKQIDHSQWGHFLKHHVMINRENVHLVNYASIKKEDMASLHHYIHQMETINIDEYNRNEQLAYWLNLYNALTVSIVYRYFPVNSIQDINISPGLFSVGPWGARLVRVKNIPLSLDDIHNRIIRPIWNDTRTHYAINNATIGAANIQKYPFEGHLIDKQLNDVATDYINSKRGAQVISGHLIISKIYKWYARDFGMTDSDLIRHLQFFARQPLKNQLRHIQTIDGHIYNWHLNAVAA